MARVATTAQVRHDLAYQNTLECQIDEVMKRLAWPTIQGGEESAEYALKWYRVLVKLARRAAAVASVAEKRAALKPDSLAAQGWAMVAYDYRAMERYATI